MYHVQKRGTALRPDLSLKIVLSSNDDLKALFFIPFERRQFMI